MSPDILKLWLDFAKFILGSIVLAGITYWIDAGFKERQIAIEETHEIGNYIEIALDKNAATRRRFAEYFATVTRSDGLRFRWNEYLKLVILEEKIINDSIKRNEAELDSLESLAQQMRVNFRNDSTDETHQISAKINKLNRESERLKNELKVEKMSNQPQIQNDRAIQSELKKIPSDYKYTLGELSPASLAEYHRKNNRTLGPYIGRKVIWPDGIVSRVTANGNLEVSCQQITIRMEFTDPHIRKTALALPENTKIIISGVISEPHALALGLTDCDFYFE